MFVCFGLGFFEGRLGFRVIEKGAGEEGEGWHIYGELKISETKLTPE